MLKAFCFIHFIEMSTGSLSLSDEVLCPKLENKVYSKGLPCAFNVFNQKNSSRLCLGFTSKRVVYLFDE